MNQTRTYFFPSLVTTPLDVAPGKEANHGQ
jgi:hypothetical protein